ncbi:YggT family protein [Desulfothermus okinawensis JCM 13304]
MFIIANLLKAVAFVLDSLLSIYFWIVIISALLSWVRPDPYNPIVRFLYSITEPVFYKVRKWIPFVYISGIDLSPIVVLLIIEFLKIFLVQTLYQLAFYIA